MQYTVGILYQREGKIRREEYLVEGSNQYEAIGQAVCLFLVDKTGCGIIHIVANEKETGKDE